MKRDHQETIGGAGNSIGNKAESSSSSMATGKGKLWVEDDQDAGGMDELLAVLGYKIKSSEMADVAQKLEQLEMVLGSEDGISHLASDTVHYNPSDLSGWVQSMLSELNNLPSPDLDSSTLLSNNQDSNPSTMTSLDFPNNSQSKAFVDDSEYDLRAIPGVAAYPQQEFDKSNDRKRMKLTLVGSNTAPTLAVNSLQSSNSSCTPSSSPQAIMAVSGTLSEPTRPVVLIDSQETGVRLVHTLLACAEAIQQENLKLADALVKHIGVLAASQAGAMRKVATYFAEALARRIYKIFPQDHCLDSSYSDTLEMHFYETCPYLKFAHFTANQAILEAFANASRVHPSLRSDPFFGTSQTKVKESTERERENYFSGTVGLEILIPRINFVSSLMGLSFSILLSAWSAILGHKFFGSKDTVENTVVRSLSFGRRDGEMDPRTNSFKRDGSETTGKFDGSDKMSMERSLSFDNWDSNETKAKPSDSTKNSNSLKFKANEIVHLTKPTISLPEPPVIFFSPRPISELDAAATKVQKVYKSYRTRRNLADCAVVVEELWWKALDFATLKRSSVSFFSIEKHETAMSKWARAKTRVAKLGKGLSKDEKAQKLALQHWLEAIDPRHRYGHNLHFYYDIWSDSMSTQPFFYWLDIGDGKEVNLEKCPRSKLQRQCIQYLGPKEREAFEVIVEGGKLVYRQAGILINTTEDTKWIFVLSTSRSLYVGQKNKGVFQHSSFLAGAATTAAGRLVAQDGVLQAIWPYSGHYLPNADNFKEFISFLEEHNVDLTNVKKCSIDDDHDSFKVVDDKEIKEVFTTITSTDTKASDVDGPIDNTTANTQQDSTDANAAKLQAPVFDLSKRLSCKWTSGYGPRIGCVRDYPAELQSRALEQVNLSPRTNPGAGSRVPIPSPRPSPKIRVSPRLAYMGLPSPRVSVN